MVVARAAVVVALWSAATAANEAAERHRAAFGRFAARLGKPYAVGQPAEFERRLAVFADNLDFAEEHNARGNSSFTLGATGPLPLGPARALRSQILMPMMAQMGQ